MTLGMTPVNGLKDDSIGGVPKFKAVERHEPNCLNRQTSRDQASHSPVSNSSSRYCVPDETSVPPVGERGEGDESWSSVESWIVDATDSRRAALGAGVKRDGLVFGTFSPNDCERPSGLF